jgi:hypothetical protein
MRWVYDRATERAKQYGIPVGPPGTPPRARSCGAAASARCPPGPRGGRAGARGRGGQGVAPGPDG